MKHTRPRACLSVELLRHVRDARPTEAALIAWLGDDASKFHVLRRAGLLVVNDGVVELSPEHRSNDGRTFRYEDLVFRLDEGTTLVVRRT